MADHITEPFRRVTSYTQALWVNPTSPEEREAAVDLLQVKYETKRVSTKYSPHGPRGKKHVEQDHRGWFPTVYLINPNHMIGCTEKTTIGPTSMHTLAAHQLSFLKSLIRKDIGEVRMDQDTRADANCPTCTFKGTDTRCKIARHCEGWYHSRCNPIRNDECTACSLPKEDTSESTVHPLTTEEISALENSTGTIYTSTDGSVKGVLTVDASSTWGLCIQITLKNGEVKYIRRKGKIMITAGEESSYRVELEGLIQIYLLLPQHIRTRHACDNESAVKAHNNIRYHISKAPRKWAKVEYRTTLDRLHEAIAERDGETLHVVHTHSHMEHILTDNADLNKRRHVLAVADKLADEGHTLQARQSPQSAREQFTVHGPNGPIEKNVGAHTIKHFTNKCKIKLRGLSMEGAIARHVEDSPNTSKQSSLPDHLLIVRTKVLLNRLPTREERNRRGDKHADGTQIGKQCPHCTDITETHIHALVECSLNKELAAKLTFNINLEIRKTSSTLMRRGKEDASTLEAHLEGTRTQPYKIRKGWSTKYTDKHGRETITGQGPNTVGTYSGVRTMHPSLFMKRMEGQLFTHSNVEETFRPTFEDSIDIHWLEMLLTQLPTQSLLSAVEDLPLTVTSQNVNQIERMDIPLNVHEYCVWDAHNITISTHIRLEKAVEAHLSYNTAPLLVICKDKTVKGMNLTRTIEPDTIQINTAGFWRGKQKGSHKATNEFVLYVHTSPNCTIEEIHTIDLVTRLTSTQSFEHKDGDSQHRIFDTPLAETPKSVHECIKGNTTTEAKLALRIGYLTAAQAEEIIEGGTPQRSLTALTAKLENTCLTHTQSVERT